MLRFAPSLHRRFAWNLVVVAVLAGSAAVTASRVDAAEESPHATRLADIYREQNIQRQLPVAPPRAPPVGRLGIPTTFAWGLLGVAVVGVVVLALWLAGFGLDTATNAPGRFRTQRGAGVTRGESEPAVPADWSLLADDLARQGRFAEAIHMLLLGVLGTLAADAPSSRAEHAPSRAMTAREIARTTAGPQREPLQALVQASELVHFGGRSATREQFEACRRDAVQVDRAIVPSVA